jgi:hypothetical protein
MAVAERLAALPLSHSPERERERERERETWPRGIAALARTEVTSRGQPARNARAHTRLSNPYQSTRHCFLAMRCRCPIPSFLLRYHSSSLPERVGRQAKFCTILSCSSSVIVLATPLLVPDVSGAPGRPKRSCTAPPEPEPRVTSNSVTRILAGQT